METKKYFVSIGMLLLFLFVVSCRSKVSQLSVPTRVASHPESKHYSPTRLLESDQIDFLHASKKELFVHLSENQDKDDVSTDTFLNQVRLISNQAIEKISSHTSSIRSWNTPLWSDGTKTWWKTVDPMKEKKEILWTDEAETRQDQYEILPGSFVADLQNHCMLFQEQEGVFTILDGQDASQPSLYRISHSFSTISTNTDNPNNYLPSNFHKFQSGYLLIVSNYSTIPYRYIFFPLSHGKISQPIEISIPTNNKEEWFLADTNAQANVFVLLDFTQLIAHENTLQFPNAPPVDEESAKVAKIVIVDLLNPESPLVVESNVHLASAVRILSHPNGAQICIVPKYLEVHPIQTPIWNRSSNSIQTQNPVYVSLDGTIFSNPSLRFLRTDPASWLLFVSGKDSSKTGWILSCKATSENLLMIPYQITYEDDFLITNMVSLDNHIYYSVVNKLAYFSPMAQKNEDRKVHLEMISNQP